MTNVLLRHPCGVNACPVEVGGDYLFCGRHWKMVPQKIRRLVLDAFDAWKRRPDDSDRAIALRLAQDVARKSLELQGLM